MAAQGMALHDLPDALLQVKLAVAPDLLNSLKHMSHALMRIVCAYVAQAIAEKCGTLTRRTAREVCRKWAEVFAPTKLTLR